METILQILRILINDTAEVNSDADLNKIIVVAASFVQQEITFSRTYTLDILSPSITPDPTDSSFMNFVAMKAAIFLTQGELRDLSMNSIRIVDGPSTIDLSSQYKNKKSLLDALLEQYAKDKIAFGMNDSIGGYRAVVSTPTTVSYL